MTRLNLLFIIIIIIFNRGGKRVKYERLKKEAAKVIQERAPAAAKPFCGSDYLYFLIQDRSSLLFLIDFSMVLLFCYYQT